MSILDWVKVNHDTPYGFYRSIYKYTACGPTVGLRLRWEAEEITPAGPCAGEPYSTEKEEWFWCDDLCKWPPFSEFEELEIEITGVAVGSIVEGVDQCADTIYLEADEDTEVTAKEFWEAVESVDKHADEIWKNTHGCEECSKLGGHVGEWGEPTEGCDGMTPVHPDCKNPWCMGTGIPI